MARQKKGPSMQKLTVIVIITGLVAIVFTLGCPQNQSVLPGLFVKACSPWIAGDVRPMMLRIMSGNNTRRTIIRTGFFMKAIILCPF